MNLCTYTYVYEYSYGSEKCWLICKQLVSKSKGNTNEKSLRTSDGNGVVGKKQGKRALFSYSKIEYTQIEFGRRWAAFL